MDETITSDAARPSDGDLTAALTIEKLRDKLEAQRLYTRVLCRAVDEATDFAGTVAGGSSWWDDVWPEHVEAIYNARDNIERGAYEDEMLK